MLVSPVQSPSPCCLEQVASIGDTFYEELTGLVEKIIKFIERHQDVFFMYATSLAIMVGMGATMGQLAQALVPGFVFMLTTENGRDLPEDLLEEIKDNQKKPKYWIPEKGMDLRDCQSLKERNQLLDTIEKWIQVGNEQGWVLLHGQPRIGKSVMAQEIVRRAKENGQRVFRLSKMIYEAKTKNPYLTVAEKLNEIAVKSLKPPVLLIDEFGKIPKDLFSAIYEKSNDFNVLAIQSDFQEATTFHGRFELMIRQVPPLDTIGAELTLINSIKFQFPDYTISSNLIHQLVGEIFSQIRNSKEEKLLYYTLKILAHSCARLEKGSNVTYYDCKEALESLSYSLKS